MKHTFETEENKADKFFKLDNSIFDNENLSTSSDSGSEKMPELIINLKSLPDVSTVISDMVNFGPHNHVYKEIYGTGNSSEVA